MAVEVVDPLQATPAQLIRPVVFPHLRCMGALSGVLAADLLQLVQAT
jgi:hypothetical protein